MPAQQGWHGVFGTLDAAHAQVSRQESARESCAELSRLLILRQPIAGCTRAFHASPNGRSPAQAQPPANRSWRRDPPLPCAQAMPLPASLTFAAESWMMSQLVEATLRRGDDGRGALVQEHANAQRMEAERRAHSGHVIDW